MKNLERVCKNCKYETVEILEDGFAQSRCSIGNETFIACQQVGEVDFFEPKLTEEEKLADELGVFIRSIPFKQKATGYIRFGIMNAERLKKYNGERMKDILEIAKLPTSYNVELWYGIRLKDFVKLI